MPTPSSTYKKASRSNLVSKWLGLASLTNTAIYADALGEEERAIAARLWG